MKGLLFYVYASYIVRKEYSYHKEASRIQKRILDKNLKSIIHSEYGMDYNLNEVVNYDSFREKAPLNSYEDIKSYIDKLKAGEKQILTKGKIIYLLKTSGTSSGEKFIPITKSGLKNQIRGALKLLCFYAVDKGDAEFVKKEMMFLQGSPLLEFEHAIPTGRLSGVVYHHVPKFFKRNKLPSYIHNIITNWQEKIRKISLEVIDKNISVFGGIPPWCMQFFELLVTQKGAKNLKEIFPNLSLYIYGGLDYSSYKISMKNILGEGVDVMQTFPASEGFFAVQDKIEREDMLLLIHQGIFYEFILQNSQQISDKTITLEDVELTKIYELVITTDSGLCRYRMGDLIQFTSLSPYRIKVVGRTSQFISAFGEHVIGSEVEDTMLAAMKEYQLKISEYHLAPDIKNKRYEWLIEWELEPENLETISGYFDQFLASKNTYYKHLIEGSIINSCELISLTKGSFQALRNQLGKEGGQNKVIRISNDHQYASSLKEMSNYLGSVEKK